MVDSWAVELAGVGPIYPFVGTEWLWLIVCVAFWVFWHFWQGRHENDTYAADMKRLDTPEKLAQAMREQKLP